jgi:hypothetical protein
MNWEPERSNRAEVGTRKRLGEGTRTYDAIVLPRKKATQRKSERRAFTIYNLTMSTALSIYNYW